jgi:hypothetical protein
LLAKTINFFGTVRTNQKGILRDFRNELKMRPDDIKTRVRNDLRAIAQKYKQNLNTLINMHCPLAEGNFFNESGNAVKPAIVQDYIRHMKYVDKCDCMRHTYFNSRWMRKWPSPGSFNSEDF